MADSIFLAGSCAKSALYSTIKNAMINAGWQNISSLASTDYDVMYSAGNDGTRGLCIQMRPQNTTGANSVETTDYSQMSIRLIDSYTPGAPGVAGTFGRPSATWLGFSLVNEANNAYAIPQTSTMDYRMFVDKNKIVMIIWPPAAYSLNPIAFFLGLPDTTFASEPLSRGVIYAHSFSAPVAGSLYVSNTPGGSASINAPEQITVISQLAPKNPNAAGAYCISEMYYGNATEGTRGKIDGLYALPNQNIVSGDILTIGSAKYQVVITYISIAFSSFSSSAIAFRIE